MRHFIFILVIGLLSKIAIAQNSEYLLRVNTERQEFIYPPNTNFILQNEAEQNILDFKKLKRLRSYNVNSENPVTLYVFNYWNDEPDVFEISSGVLLAEKVENQFMDINEDEEASNEFKNGLEIKKKTFFESNDGYGVSIIFNNGVIFYYRDGKATAWQNGKQLEMAGNYIIPSAEGIVKLSSNPDNQDIYYYFQPSEEKSNQ